MMNHQINIGFETEVADENSVRELIRTCAERVLKSEQVDLTPKSTLPLSMPTPSAK